MEGPSKRVCAILFADIAGSTRLYETLGDEAAKTRVTALQEEIVATAVRAGGKVREIVGDEVMLCFVEAGDGAACALAIQQNVASLPGNADVRLAVRIGLHWGQVIVEGDRLFGDTINVAARVTAVAQGGQIITTQAVVDRLPEGLQRIARHFDLAPIKGKREPLLVYDLPWKAQDRQGVWMPQDASLTCALAPDLGGRIQVEIASKGRPAVRLMPRGYLVNPDMRALMRHILCEIC